MKKNDKLDPDLMPEWLAKVWPRHNYSNNVIAGVNEDDCGVVSCPKGVLIITTDYINSRPFVMELGIGNMETLGRLVVDANLSDLCSTGANPKYFMSAITMPHESLERDYKKIIFGIKEECLKHNVSVIGGDSKLGKSLAINGTAIGFAKSKNNLFLKNKAMPEQLLWSSGNLGSCSAAILGYASGGVRYSWNKWAKNVLIRPEVPIDKSRKLSLSQLGIAGIDVSDGLGNDIYRLCKASNVGVIIEADKLPVAQEVQEYSKTINIPSWVFPFASGGEFQFIVTSAMDAYKKMNSMGFHLIGQTTKRKLCKLKLPNHKIVPLPFTGHRDARNLSFVEEIKLLLKEACDYAKSNRIPAQKNR